MTVYLDDHGRDNKCARLLRRYGVIDRERRIRLAVDTAESLRGAGCADLQAGDLRRRCALGLPAFEG